MANKIVEILLQAKDTASATFATAEKNLTRTTSTIGTALKALGALAVTAALGQFFKDAVEEGAAAEKGMVRLGIAVGNAGGNFAQLRPALETAVEGVRRLTTYSDDQLRGALTNLITITGDTGASMKNLGVVADFAAFKQIDLETASLAVAKAMNGNTTALNKLGIEGKDAATVMGNLRAAVGGFAEGEAKTFSGRLTQLIVGWGEFKEAVGLAILGNGEAGASVGGLTEALRGLELWVTANAEPISRLVAGLLDLGKAFVQIGDVIGSTAKLLGVVFTDLIVGPIAAFEAALGGILTGLGLLFNSDAMKAGGEKLIAAATATFTRIGTETQKAVDQATTAGAKLAGALFSKEALHGAVNEWELILKETGVKRKKFTADELDAQKKADADRVALAKKAGDELTRVQGATSADLLRVYEGSTEKLATETVRRHTLVADLMKNGLVKQADQLKDAWKKQDDANLLLAAGFDKQLVPAMAHTTFEFGALRDAAATVPGQLRPLTKSAEQVAAEMEAAKEKAKDLRDAIADGLRGAIGFAGGLGGISDAAQAAANNMVSLGSSVAKVLQGGLSATGLVGAITAAAGALTGILGSLFGKHPSDAGREEIVRKNTDALAKLTDATLLDVQASGSKLQKVQDVLAGSVFQPYGAKADSAYAKLKLQAGITDKDIEDIAQQLGMEIRNPKTGKIEFNALRQVLAALQQMQVGYGASFTEQMSRISEGKRIGAIKPGDEFGQVLAAAGAGGANAITAALQGADLSSMTGREAAAGSLRTLFSNMGSLSKGQLGGLNEQEFISAIESLVGLLTNVDQAITGPNVLVPTPDRPAIENPALAALRDQEATLRAQVQQLADAANAAMAGGDWSGATELRRQANMAANKADELKAQIDALAAPLVDPLSDVATNLGNLTAVGTQQVDYLGSIDANIGAMLDRWTDIDTGQTVRAPASITVTVGDVVVGGLASGATPADVQVAVQAAILQSLNEALGTTYRAQQIARGIV